MRKERLVQIEEYISGNGFVTMEQIMDKFDIAMPTVRKDISELASQGLIEKVYGGAKAVVAPSKNMHMFKNRRGVHMEAKNAIASKAAELVDDGDVIYIDSGTTAAAIIEYLTGRHVTVITSNMAAVMASAEMNNIDVYVLGGKFNRDTMSVDHADSEAIMKEFNVDKAFMAATGYSIEGGLAQDSPTECDIKKHVIRKATDTFLIIDSSKIGKKALIRYAEPDAIKTIITDGQVDRKYKDYFKKNSINVI
ncbi:MAG: DeoR/GlpR family DNA-binding transcription regulator [Clostridia bacterium]|nr:DeoR/GlpR family DNA-binding transcription regulator [Clostridia bacterium]